MKTETLSIEIQKIHKKHPDMGYRRIRDELDGHKGIHVNDKRVLRICRKYDIKSNIKWKPKSCTSGDRNPDHIAKNYLHRDFHADKPNEKWLTDVSEFKYYGENEVHKIYLSVFIKYFIIHLLKSSAYGLQTENLSLPAPIHLLQCTFFS